MAKKSDKPDFRIAADKFISSRAEAISPQDEHEPHEEQHMQNNNDALDAHDKKARKKLPRINMAFYGENYDYLTYISRLSGKNITEYVNSLVDKDREINQDKIDKAKEILNG